jgi:hypothetical protein
MSHDDSARLKASPNPPRTTARRMQNTIQSLSQSRSSHSKTPPTTCAESASLALSDQTRARRGRHNEPWSSQGAATMTPPTTCAICAESPSPVPSDQTPAHCGGYDERVEPPGRSHDDLADDRCDLRGVRRPRPATKRQTRARRGGDCVVWHVIGRMSPTSFAHQTRHLLAANFTSTHTVLDTQRSTKNRAPRSSHDDIVATCANCPSFFARAERPNTGTSQQARRTRGAPREQPPRRHRGRPARSARRASPASSD